MEFDFTGKRVLITDAGTDIGGALAIALYKSGCHVYAVSRTESTLETLKDECPNMTTIMMDIDNLIQMEAMFNELEAMDGIVNNAFMSAPASVMDTTKEAFVKVMNTDIWAATRIMQIFSKKMINAKRKGSIVNVSSMDFKLTNKNMFLFCLSKAAIDMMSKHFAAELGQYEIRVNSINLAQVMSDADTNSILNVDHSLRASYPSRTPRNKIAEVVHPIMYLLSDYSSKVTGSDHIIDCSLLTVFNRVETSVKFVPGYQSDKYPWVPQYPHK